MMRLPINWPPNKRGVDDERLAARAKWILKICTKSQVLISHVSKLLDEHLAKNVQGENISTPIYVQCNLLSRVLEYLV